MSRRFQELQKRLEEQDARALLVVAGGSRDPDFLPFAGEGRISRALVVVPRGQAPHLLYFTPMEREEAARAEALGCRLLSPERVDMDRWVRQSANPEELLATLIGQAFLHAGVPPGRILLAGRGPAGDIQSACRALERDGWRFESGQRAIAWARRFNGEEDFREIRRVAAATCEAFRRVADLLRRAEVRTGRELWLEGAPLSVGRLKGEIAALLARAELEQPEGSVVAPAEEGAVPHNQGTPERVLKAGESLIVDLFPRGRLFADCTRTFCVGEPPEALARAHGAVLVALQEAHGSTRDGVWGWDLQTQACDLLEARGYPTLRRDPGSVRGYVHGLGHGVGYALHDAPSFRDQDRGEGGHLRAGDVVTLEPGLYDPEEGWAVRLEDLVRVGERDCENWTPLPYALDPHAWDLPDP